MPPFMDANANFMSKMTSITLEGPVARKPINANRRLIINQGLFVSLSQNLFSPDFLQNFRLKEANPIRGKAPKETFFHPKVENLKPTFYGNPGLRNRLSNNRVQWATTEN